jgi:FKBP12-rapamycin complex-associated protein
MVMVQQLVELEEVITYKTGPLPLQRRVVAMWEKRLKDTRDDVGVWQQILGVRSLVLDPQQHTHAWLGYASLCRKDGRLHLSIQVLTGLLGFSPTKLIGGQARVPLPKADPKVLFACLKHLYAAGSPMESRLRLKELLRHPDLSPTTASTKIKELRARCSLKLGIWTQDLAEKGALDDGAAKAEALACFQAATLLDPTSSNACRQWALINFTASMKGTHKASAAEHTVPAIKGFFHGISLRGSAAEGTLQDVLRILALLYQYGSKGEVEQAISRGIEQSSVDIWLEAVPQIIARMHTPHPLVGKVVHTLLTKIGRAHPQALVYPLTVASKSQSQARFAVATSVLNGMRHDAPALVEQSLLVSGELVRVASLWAELWQVAIEAGSQLMAQRDWDQLVSLLLPLHLLVEEGPVTARESAFDQLCGADLRHAHACCDTFLRTRDTHELEQAWAVYTSVFRRVHEQKDVELQLADVSPRLLAARDMALAVPGSYRVGQSGEEVVCIQRFLPTLKILESKRHPRRIFIVGSDGHEYSFLLKGHEDLRQDERAMQLFGLVNALLAGDRTTLSTDLSIQRYAVIPLSPNSGLIEWVPNCPTMHSLIKHYRALKRIRLNVEQRLMNKLSPTSTFTGLSLMQKVQVFSGALALTTGADLQCLLWLKSPNAQVWLARRTNYTRSMAVMSMTGYVLGLGDRHPCNLMMDRDSGKIIHIDFGDCFEAAMHRDKFPEKVPFRLTRMLVNAMEVVGIEGTYRATCEKVLTVLRKNKTSVMAVLEAFVYDPLIGWRILETPKAKSTPGSSPRPPDPLSSPRLSSRALPAGDATGRSPRPPHRALPAGDYLLGTSLEQDSASPPPTLTSARRATRTAADYAAAATTTTTTTTATMTTTTTTTTTTTIAEPVVPLLPLASSLTSALSHAATARLGSTTQNTSTRTHTTTVLTTKSIPTEVIPTSTNASTTTTTSTTTTSKHEESSNSSKKQGWGGPLKGPGTPIAILATRDGGIAVSSFAPAYADDGEMVVGTPIVRSVMGGSLMGNPLGASVVGSVAGLGMGGGSSVAPGSVMDEDKNAQAVMVISTVERKLNGTDFSGGTGEGPLSVPAQVDHLIQQATSHVNLCQSYIGWCPFW